MVNPIYTFDTPDTRGLALSTLSIDGVRLNDLQDLYDLNTTVLGGQRWNSPNQFWASPARLAGSTTREVLDIALSAPRRINHVSFQISKFPCRVWLQWLNPETGKWTTAKQYRRKKGNQVRKPFEITINESVPQRITRHVNNNQHRHPHHKAPGHWENVNRRISPIYASRFRLVIVRLPNKSVPLEVGTGKQVPYSIAVKDFQVGYEALSREDLWPVHVRTQNVDVSEAFSSTVDLLGSSVEFSLIEYRASDLLWPGLQAIDGLPKSLRDGEADIWKSEPQPFPWAVVNLYADSRQANGDGQVVDRFYLDPTTPEVSFNLYYSSDTPDASIGFSGSTEPIRYPALQDSGVVIPTSTGNQFLATEFGYLDLSQKYVQRDRSQPWWVGLKVQPQFSSTNPNDWVVYESPYMCLRWSGAHGSWVFEFNGRTVERATNAFSASQQMSFLIAYTGGGDMWLFMDDGWAENIEVNPLDYNLSAALREDHPALLDIIRFGGRLVAPGSDPGKGNYILNGYVLKTEALTDESRDAFLSQTADVYLTPPRIEDEDSTGYGDNALARAHPYYATDGMTSRNPYGFVGGPGTSYESLTWTPINRDFRLRKGVIQFDPVMARFFKFEFTNLAAQPYQSFEPVSRTVRLFTADMWTKGSTGLPRDPTNDPGIKVVQANAGVPMFSDQRRLEYLVNPDRAYDGYTPTEALYARDPSVQQRLEVLNPMFRLSPWRESASRLPRFTQTQKHTYETVEVEHTSNTAYFVGLNEIRMYRVNYEVADDTEAYTIPFYDRVGLDDENDPFPWASLAPHGITVNSLISGKATTTSKPLLSRRNVRGVQFATMQTPAKQILTDPEFTDVGLSYWDAYGGAGIQVSSAFNSDIGSTLEVTRRLDGAFWDYVEDLYPTWDAVEATGATWDELGNLDANAQSFGGVTSADRAFVQPPAGGRIYAAARVYTPSSLEGPLHLQIVTPSGEVLAEEIVEPKGGAISEWYCSYTVGDFGDYSGVPDWDTLEATYLSWDDVEDVGTWDYVMGGVKTPYDGPVGVRLFQVNPTHDVFYVDNLSLFEDPIVWEFSNDGGETWWPAYEIRNNPNGVLLFPQTPEESLLVTEDTSLRWRVNSYRPGVTVTALVIRPWYATLRFGPSPRETLDHGGPNLSKYDQYPSVADSPPFKAWHKPIPQSWWFHYRQWLLQGGIEIPGSTSDAPTLLLNDHSLLFHPEGI